MSERSMSNLKYVLFLILPALVGWFFILLIIALGLDPTR